MDDPRGVFGLEGRVAVVTGAASGIGLAIGEVLVGAGARVVLGDIDDVCAAASRVVHCSSNQAGIPLWSPHSIV